jgi:hypothetical protein
MAGTTGRTLAIGLSVLICGLSACATPAQRAELHARQAVTQCLLRKGGSPNVCAQQLAALGAGVQCQAIKQTYAADGHAIPTRYVWACTTEQQRAVMAYSGFGGFGGQNQGNMNGALASPGTWLPTYANGQPNISVGAWPGPAAGHK